MSSKFEAIKKDGGQPPQDGKVDVLKVIVVVRSSWSGLQVSIMGPLLAYRGAYWWSWYWWWLPFH